MAKKSDDVFCSVSSAVDSFSSFSMKFLSSRAVRERANEMMRRGGNWEKKLHFKSKLQTAHPPIVSIVLDLGIHSAFLIHLKKKTKKYRTVTRTTLSPRN